jgi:hypothetical protein
MTNSASNGIAAPVSAALAAMRRNEQQLCPNVLCEIASCEDEQ